MSIPVCASIQVILDSSFHSPFQVIAMIYWWFWGYKTFTGPQANFTVKARKNNNSSGELVEDIKEE